MDGAKIWERLAKADEHIRKTEGRISRQRKVIADLSAAGWNTKNAEKLLGILTATLQVKLQHHQIILSELTNAELKNQRFFSSASNSAIPVGNVGVRSRRGALH